MSDGSEDDSLSISIETMSSDMSFIHLAETSMIAIILPFPGFVPCTLIDLIDCGVAYATGSVGAVADQDVPL